MSPLDANLLAVRQRIQRACDRAQRDPQSVRLIAVSKRHSAGAIREAHALGLRDFGENYVQELSEKRRILGDLKDVRWHLIGHLQSNKVAKAVAAASVVHTLDSSARVRDVARHAGNLGVQLDVFIEVNLGGEGNKSGTREEDLSSVVTEALDAPHLRLVGLMAIPPLADDPQRTRPYFQRLRSIAERFGLPRVSMGMSSDFEVAIEEGATDVRIGSALFGARD